MAGKRHYKDALSRNRSMEEIARDLLSPAGGGQDQMIYKVRNAGQGRKIRERNRDN